MTEEEKTMKDKVEDLKTTTINFSITKCPLKVYKEFVRFCSEETNDNYSFGLKLLLDGMKGNVKEATLYQQYLEMKEEMKELKVLLNKPEPEKQKIKTMGSG